MMPDTLSWFRFQSKPLFLISLIEKPQCVTHIHAEYTQKAKKKILCSFNQKPYLVKNNVFKWPIELPNNLRCIFLLIFFLNEPIVH